VLFAIDHLPQGFVYETDVLTDLEEQALVEHIRALPFREYEFHGYTGKRRVVSFGWRYDHNAEALERAAPLPDFLTGLRERVAGLASVRPTDFVHVLVTEYTPGTTIGWHRDKYVFGDVAGVSLASPCFFRFRRKAGDKWERYSFRVEPRSCYLLRGESRSDWEHSIRPVEALRYSITFRTLRRPVISGVNGSEGLSEGGS
jgi:alkylated DNA repair dioxygenase AlkB